MTVFGTVMGKGSAAGRYHQQQVWPVDDEEADATSRRVVEAAERGDLSGVAEGLADSSSDVNYAGALRLSWRRTVVALREEEADEVSEEREELRTHASPLFLAAHAGHLLLLRFLLEKGADVNQKLFGGYALTAAVREGHAEAVEMLLKAGASQPACEEAVVEASLHGRARLAGIVMGYDLIRPKVATRAFITAAARGFVGVVDALVKCGVDANATDRMLLRSLKPSLHINADCTALVAAIVSRQVDVVRRLLQIGVRMDTKVRLGAWSWDAATGEEFRVGAGLAEPYGAAWCAVEYYECTGTVLRLLLQHHSPNGLHLGRSLLHHAILCANPQAVGTLLAAGADCELPVKTSRNNEFHPIHMASRLGLPSVLQILIDNGCDLDARTESGDTALMLCTRHKRDDCVRVLVSAGADLGLVNSAGASAVSIAASTQWNACFQYAVIDVMRSGTIPRSSDPSVFCSMSFAATAGDAGVLEVLLAQPDVDIDGQDADGNSSLMVAAREGNVEAFRFLVFAGANVKLRNARGETALDLSLSNESRDLFEQVMLEFTLENGSAGGFYALHYAARRGDFTAVRLLTSMGYDTNILDGDGYTPLMLAAKEGHGAVCELLIACGAKCDAQTPRRETALSLARTNTKLGAEAVSVIMDELGRLLVLQGGRVEKHTKCGKGAPHEKVLRMVASTGLLRWGKSSRRNVVCREAEVGASAAFLRNRKAMGGGGVAGMFRVVTNSGREVHFVCEGGKEMAELWVRGIRVVAKAALVKGAVHSEHRPLC